MPGPSPPLPDLSLTLSLALIAASLAPVLLLGEDLQVVAASRSFREAFEVGPDDIPGCSLTELGNGAWGAPQLRTLLRVSAQERVRIEPYEMDYRQTGEPPRRLVLNISRLDAVVGHGVYLLLTIQDVTEDRAAARRTDDLVRSNTLLVQEVQHRVANSLQIIASVLMQGVRRVGSDESQSHLRDAHHRIMSVAAVQKQLAATTLGHVRLKDYLTNLCHSLGDSMISNHARVTLQVTADDSVASSGESVSLGLIVTELVINALKHAFPDDRAGAIAVDYRSDAPGWVLTVADDGVGISKAAQSGPGGLGTGIVKALAGQLAATVETLSANPGTRVTVRHAVDRAGL